MNKWGRDIIIGVVVLILGAACVLFANIPTRVSVVETKLESTGAALLSMDKKLDLIIERVGQ